MRKFDIFEYDGPSIVRVVAYSYPEGYPVFYICADDDCLCPTCVEDNLPEIGQARKYHDDQWDIVGQEINYEDPSLFCDHCGNRIESAYAEDEART